MSILIMLKIKKRLGADFDHFNQNVSDLGRRRIYTLREWFNASNYRFFKSSIDSCVGSSGTESSVDTVSKLLFKTSHASMIKVALGFV
jgi:hypothetical protein